MLPGCYIGSFTRYSCKILTTQIHESYRQLSVLKFLLLPGFKYTPAEMAYHLAHAAAGHVLTLAAVSDQSYYQQMLPDASKTFTRLAAHSTVCGLGMYLGAPNYWFYQDA